MVVPADLETPVALVDLDVLDRNIEAMAATARDAGVSLRPHAKTHKSPQIASRQVEAGARGLTVATLSEAEVFADAGFTDLFIAYPIWAGHAKGPRLRALLDRVDLAVGVDSVEGARALAAQLGDARRQVRVLVEIDSGHHRTGVAPQAAGELADAAVHAGLDVRGVFTFPGHSYLPGVQSQVAASERDALREAADAMTARDLRCEVVSGGSTPTARLVQGPLSELRPGVYVFGDAQQLELDSCRAENIALTVLATVVSHAGGNVVLDSGSKALGADRASWATGFGRLLDHPGARVTSLSEHHAVVRWDDTSPPPELGSPIRVVPNHVCNTVNLADELVVVHNGVVVDRWPVAARGANT